MLSRKVFCGTEDVLRGGRVGRRYRSGSLTGAPTIFMDFLAAIGPLEDALGDPRQGLPEDVFLFVSRITPLDQRRSPDPGRTAATRCSPGAMMSSFDRAGTSPGAPSAVVAPIADSYLARALRQELGAEVLLRPGADSGYRNHSIVIVAADISAAPYRCRLLIRRPKQTLTRGRLRIRPGKPVPGAGIRARHRICWRSTRSAASSFSHSHRGLCTRPVRDALPSPRPKAISLAVAFSRRPAALLFPTRD